MSDRDEMRQKALEVLDRRVFERTPPLITLDDVAELMCSVERETRLKEARDLQWLMAAPTNFVDLCKALEAHIDKLRGEGK